MRIQFGLHLASTCLLRSTRRIQQKTRRQIVCFSRRVDEEDLLIASQDPLRLQNDQFLGQDLLNEPERRLSTQYAVKNRTAVVQGPFEEDGTLMVYNRQPVFIRRYVLWFRFYRC